MSSAQPASCPTEDLCAPLSGISLSPYGAITVGYFQAADGVVAGAELGLGSWTKLGGHLASLPLPHWVTLGKLLDFSEPHSLV